MGQNTTSLPYWGWGNSQPSRRCLLNTIPLERRLDPRGGGNLASRVGLAEDEARETLPITLLRAMGREEEPRALAITEGFVRG